MVMAVDLALVLVVAVLSSKDRGTDRAGEVINMVFSLERGDVRASEGPTTLEAYEVEAREVVGFAERVLVRRMVGNGEELGSDDFPAVLLKISIVALRGSL